MSAPRDAGREGLGDPGVASAAGTPSVARRRPIGAARAALRAGTKRLVRVEDHEITALFWSCAYFFFLLSSYYVLRPLRETMGVAGGDGALSGLYLGTLVGTLVANPIFSALVSRFPRRVFIPIVYRFLIVNLLVFYALLTFLSEEATLQVARVFFVWVSVFNMFAVSVFWGFMADLYKSEQGKRLFGFIGVGGTLGAVAGAALTRELATRIGPINLFFVAAALLEASVFAVRRLVRVFGVDRPSEAREREADARAASRDDGEGVPPGRGVFSGLARVFRSRYLLGICLYLVLYTVSSTIVYGQQAAFAKERFTSPAERTEFFASLDLYVNVLAVVTQCFFTGRIIGAIGIGATLTILPAFTMLGFVGLGIAPVLAMLVVFQVTRRATDYAVTKPVREVLFTVVSREEKYSSKSFVDTFVYRGGDQIGALLSDGMRARDLSTSVIALLFVPVAALWALVGVILGRRAESKRVQASPTGARPI